VEVIETDPDGVTVHLLPDKFHPFVHEVFHEPRVHRRQVEQIHFDDLLSLLLDHSVHVKYHEAQRLFGNVYLFGSLRVALDHEEKKVRVEARLRLLNQLVHWCERLLYLLFELLIVRRKYI